MSKSYFFQYTQLKVSAMGPRGFLTHAKKLRTNCYIFFTIAMKSFNFCIKVVQYGFTKNAGFSVFS